MVQDSVEQAIEAVFTMDSREAQQVIDGDARIDEEEVEVEKMAINLLALTGGFLITTLFYRANRGQKIALALTPVALSTVLPPIVMFATRVWVPLFGGF